MSSKTTTNADATALGPVDLNWWSQREWNDGVQLDTVAPLESFAVRTLNSLYEITVLSPRTGEIMVRGGRFFPEATRATLAGCSLGGSFLKVRAIHLGFLMELMHDGQTIITTQVQSILPVRNPAPVH
ncbi:MAG: hypothetical protein ACRD3C_09525 [Vicinamibacterales bacterium]